jgi:Flp pilus assembly protein TadG
MRMTTQKNREQRSGATAVEFAITAPVFFLFLLAAFEFGWLNVIRHTADNAAYEAARSVIVPGATSAEAQSKAKKLLKIVGARGSKITISPDPVTTATEAVTVSIEIPMKKNGLIVPRFTGKTKIIASSTLRTERPE